MQQISLQFAALVVVTCMLTATRLATAAPAVPERTRAHDASAGIACPALTIDGGQAAAGSVDLVREGACLARDFFAAYGVQIERPISIRLVAGAIDKHANHIGLYDARAAQVTLCDLPRVQRATRAHPPFGVPMSEAMYISFVVHEVAHAIADQHFAPERPGFLVHEYIAYVAQLSTMDSALRARVLAHHPVDGFAGLSEMSAIYYGLDPNRFGVKSYLHFQATPDPRQLLHDLLSGAIHIDDSQAEWW